MLIDKPYTSCLASLVHVTTWESAALISKHTSNLELYITVDGIMICDI